MVIKHPYYSLLYRVSVSVEQVFSAVLVSYSHAASLRETGSAVPPVPYEGHRMPFLYFCSTATLALPSLQCHRLHCGHCGTVCSTALLPFKAL
ncbi:hypothetical protein STCU_09959 [Strigomonas culicis]|uniref:Uncharacterized protein n=1 Tax=Strigomonas culicis TaxID=28005 RepID=S9TJX7_9TRYP|nr:hypothetical protein STCU_09959 [Strigomonas culicis]|eukprot:EPY18462.1 hypothetical protein STCU_09959 [Strigomonas culicis]